MSHPQLSFDHIMIRVHDLPRSLAFYVDILGMHVLRQTDYPDGKFTNVFLSFAAKEHQSTALELTHNWKATHPYDKGQAYGHLALLTLDLDATVTYLRERGVRIKTPPKTMNHGQRRIAFILDPDDYLIELVSPSLTPQ